MVFSTRGYAAVSSNALYGNVISTVSEDVKFPIWNVMLAFLVCNASCWVELRR